MACAVSSPPGAFSLTVERGTACVDAVRGYATGEELTIRYKVRGRCDTEAPCLEVAFMHLLPACLACCC